MSIDRCTKCGVCIDTDEDVDCYREVNIERVGFSHAYTHDIECICNKCWEALNTEPEVEDTYGLYDTEQ